MWRYATGHRRAEDQPEASETTSSYVVYQPLMCDREVLLRRPGWVLLIFTLLICFVSLLLGFDCDAGAASVVQPRIVYAHPRIVSRVTYLILI